jgi:hypothetical protein
MKKLLFVVSFFITQQLHSIELLNNFLKSEQAKTMFKEAVTAGIVLVSAKLGWKEFQKGNLFPGQEPKEKSSAIVKKELQEEYEGLCKKVALHQKLLLYVISVCNEAERADFEALLSEEEVKLLMNMA